MMKDKIYIKYMIVLLLPLGILLNIFSLKNTYLTEKIYSNIIYKPFSQVLSMATGIFPFSVAEVFLVGSIVFILIYIVQVVSQIIRKRIFIKGLLKKIVMNILVIISIGYFAFIIMWGLNYNRMTVAQLFDLDTKPATVTELEEVCQDLIMRANNLRNRVDENPDGVMYPDKGAKDVLKRAYKGYNEAMKIYPQLSGKYGNPKGIIFSKLMAYTGIWGVYSAFTGEANVNMSIPTPSLPSTVCHEMAHQRGFAREDEANYIAYVTCSMHPDEDFKYSGVLLAMIHSMNALYKYDKDSYKDLRSTYSEGVNRDIQAITKYNNKHEGVVERKISKANDLYLKANHQKQGELSYGRVVDLLIAEYRLKNKKDI